MPNLPHIHALRPEYDFYFSKTVRGKYYKQYVESGNVVVLESDVTARFPNAASASAALRGLSPFSSGPWWSVAYWH
jgi:hypothetical protein